MAQTNHAWRRIISVILCLVMCFTSYVLCVPTASAVVTDDGASMKKTDKYGTAPWDGSDSSMASYAKWYRSSFWIQVNYAPHIYLDVSETLQSAGYKMKVTWNYGNDAGDYRILLTGAVWGENDQLSGFPAGWYAITNLFSDFSVDASSWTTTRNGQVIYGEDWRVDRDNWDNYSNDVPVLWQSGSAQDHTAYLYLQGTPNAAGTATYSTVQRNELFVVFIDDTTFGSESEQQKPAESNVMIYDAGQYWPEISYQVTVYDKSALQTEIDRAEAFKNAFANYQDYITAGDWAAFLNALDSAKSQITIREQTQADLDAARSALRSAAEALEFNVKVTDLNNQLSAAQTYKNNPNLANEYTASSVQAFNTAYNAANSFSLPNRWKPYANASNVTASDFNARASELQSRQNEVDTLTNNLADAIANLLGKANFAEYDAHLAAHPVSSSCYTSQSLSDYNTAKQTVETLKADSDLSEKDQAQVDAAIEAYIDAYEKLEEQHIYNGRVVTKKEATCTESGEDWQYCSVCDEAYQVITLDPLGHTIDYLQPTGNSFAGDCQNAPWTEYKCSVCGEAAKAYGVLDPDAHVWGDGIENPVHNCTQAGTKTYTCTVDGCGETKKETVPADGTSHVESDRTNVIPATCEEDEVIQHLCAYCDEVLSEEIVPDTALGHDYTVYVSNTEGDCVTNATTTYKCSRCDATTVVTGDVNPAVHKSASLINVKTPTCLEEGYSGDLYCSACKTTVETGEVKEKDPANHASTETKVINQKDSTCTEAGYSGDLVHSCCNAVITPGHELELAEHELQLDEERSVEANCQHGGYDLWACANCDYTEKRNEEDPNLDVHVGEIVDDPDSVYYPPDCTAEKYNTGNTIYSGCGHIATSGEAGPYADHEWDDGEQEGTVYVYHCTHEGCEVTKEESCHHTGGEATCSKKAICTNCGEEYGNLNPDNHKNTVGKDAVAATCTTDGHEAGTYCNDCGKWVTGGATIEKTGHDYQVTATEVITKATCKTPATIKYTYTCANGCGDTYDETKTDVTGALDSENHEDIVTDAAIAATCTTPGKTEGSHCEACDTVIVAQQETIALGHDWSDYVQTTDPTCTEAGEKTATCQREGCGVTKTEPVPATGHSYGEWYIAKESTCTEYGYKQRDCANCDAYERGDLTELAEHDYQWVTTDGSCTEGVTKQLKCTVCGDIKETITEEPTGHTLGEWTVTVEPGCTTAGSHYALCSVCGETVTESIPATGHTYGEGVLILHPEDADDGIGLMRYTCINCGYWYDREITDTGHTHHGGTATCVDRAVCEECGREYGGYDSSNHVNVVPMPDAEATCETDGHTGGTYCTACGATVDEPVITTPATGHVDADGDGICDVDGKPVTPEDDDEEDDIWNGYRCKMCDEYEENKDKPFIGFFYMIIHFFVHLISYINHLT